MGAVYLFGRVLYTLGYTTGDPSARNTRGGIIAALAYYRKFIVSRFERLAEPDSDISWMGCLCSFGFGSHLLRCQAFDCLS